MGVEFTRKKYLEVWLDGEYISRHTALVEAAESASEHGDGVYEIRVGSEVFYEVEIMGLLAGGSPNTPPNDPPTWTSTPNPSFEDAVGGTYALSQNTQDPEGDPLTYTLTSGSWPTGVSMNSAGLITATTSVVEGTTAGLQVDIDDGTNTPVTSATFSLVISAVGTTTQYPLLGTVRNSTFNYTQSGTLAEDDRKAIGLMDMVLLGGFFGTAQDATTPGPDFISRTDVTQEILDAHSTAFGDSNYYVFTYVNQMETGLTGDNGEKCYAETGPNGTDWWFRDQGGTLVSAAGGEAPGSGGFVNITDQVTLDSSGRNYCGYYNDVVVIGDLLDVHANATPAIGVGKGGINPWYDNLGIHTRKSGIDPDQNGSNDDMQDYYDPDNAAHVATEPNAVQFVGEYRANQREGVERAETAYPGIIKGGNTNQWYESYSGPVSGLGHIMKEYRLDENDINSKSFTQVGFSENNNWRPTELKGPGEWQRSHTYWTGVSSESGGNWQYSYNSIVHSTLKLSSPDGTSPPLMFGEWIVDCLQGSTDGPGGKPIWPAVPKTGSAWNAHRWGMVTCMLAGAHYCCSGVIDQPTSTAGERRATPLFDEFGLINGSTDYGFGSGSTKLFYKWMGAAIEPIQTVARQGTYIWMREFDNALVIINTNWDDTDPDETVDVSALPGGASEWKRFVGSQDSAWNDGTDASSDFNIPSIDAIVLVRKSWYNAL